MWTHLYPETNLCKRRSFVKLHKLPVLRERPVGQPLAWGFGGGALDAKPSLRLCWVIRLGSWHSLRYQLGLALGSVTRDADEVTEFKKESCGACNRVSLTESSSYLCRVCPCGRRQDVEFLHWARKPCSHSGHLPLTPIGRIKWNNIYKALSNLEVFKQMLALFPLTWSHFWCLEGATQWQKKTETDQAQHSNVHPWLIRVENLFSATHRDA